MLAYLTRSFGNPPSVRIKRAMPVARIAPINQGIGFFARRDFGVTGIGGEGSVKNFLPGKKI
jgi:hypothetical protein